MAVSSLLASGVLDAGVKLIDTLFDTPEERNAARLKLLEIAQEDRAAQLEVNKIEAASDSRFKSYWRPAFGWIAVGGFGLQFILFPLFQFVMTYYSMLSGEQVKYPLIQLDMEVLMWLTGGMLGLSGMRTYEKKKGLTK